MKCTHRNFTPVLTEQGVCFGFNHATDIRSTLNVTETGAVSDFQPRWLKCDS